MSFNLDMLAPEYHIYKVSELNEEVKKLIEKSPLALVAVEGEISNFKRHTSGHNYFTLKDESSQIQCVMFRNVIIRRDLELEDGIRVIVIGRLTVYVRDGKYEVIVNRIEPIGFGILQLKFEQLKQKLEREGLFSPEHKKPLPFIPKRIGIVTSITGAAIRDMLKIISERFYNSSILICPALVQGEGAAENIAEAINMLNSIDDVDVIIVGRGGGSIEDLWAFNEEVVARAIFNSKVPIISAVGHDVDYTIADFVADYRAATPTHAAQVVVPDKSELTERVNRYRDSLFKAMLKRLSYLMDRHKNVSRFLSSRITVNQIQLHQQTVDSLVNELQYAIGNIIKNKRNKLNSNATKLLHLGVPFKITEIRHRVSFLQQRLETSIRTSLDSRSAYLRILSEKLNTLSPLSILDRGYAICFHGEKIVRRADEVSEGDDVRVKLCQGEILCEVKTSRSE